MTAGVDIRPGIPRLPRVTLILLGGAVVHLVVIIASRQAFQGYLDLLNLSVVGAMVEAMPLVLAASIVAGLGRWPTQQRWLIACALAYVAAGGLDAASSAWIGLAGISDVAALRLATYPGYAAELAKMIAPLLASVGLWRAGVRLALAGRRAVVVGVVGGFAALSAVTALITAVRVWLEIERLASTGAGVALPTWTGALYEL
jgi:hypothetical protein